jgi:glutamyl/glutaminyl-tRNA synthetase
MNPASESGYRGRLAPSPTGYLHVGHARTFWVAQERALAHQGVLVLRNDDLDVSRVRSEFVRAFIEDLRWLGCQWQEGPDVGGPLGPYSQHERLNYYQDAFNRLRESGSLYPCQCSRKDILASIAAPHAHDDEPHYPGTCRSLTQAHGKVSWRFRVPDGERIEFQDALAGPISFVAGVDFGDFVVWRHDGVPSYQLACVVDDAWMKISEVVRGSDLLISTARQLLLYRAMGWEAPKFCHCPLVRDAQGQRLAKRHESLSLRMLRQRGVSAEQVRNPEVDWMRWLDG